MCVYVFVLSGVQDLCVRFCIVRGTRFVCEFLYCQGYKICVCVFVLSGVQDLYVCMFVLSGVQDLYVCMFVLSGVQDSYVCMFVLSGVQDSYVCMFVLSGVQAQECICSDSGSPREHDPGLLAYGVGTEQPCRCPSGTYAGGNTGGCGGWVWSSVLCCRFLFFYMGL